MDFLIKKSDSIKNLAMKMLSIQKAGINVSKSSNNPFFKSKYADLGEHLENILPLCNDVGIMITQLPNTSYLVTLLIDTDSGEWIESYYPITLIKQELKDGKVNTVTSSAQEIGGQITYARRYSLGAIFLVNSNDDDGNSLSNKVAKITINSKVDSSFSTAKQDILDKVITNEKQLLDKYFFPASPVANIAKSELLNLFK